MYLRANDDDLSELRDAAGNPQPELFESELNVRTGLRILRRLGVGGMATVYLAERLDEVDPRILAERTPHRVALKLLRPETVRAYARLGGDALLLFKKEVIALSKLMAVDPPVPYVVSFFGCGMTQLEVRGEHWPNVPWIALELVDGGLAGTSLKERVSGGGFDPIRLASVVRGLGMAVRTLHQVGIVHRDIKPDNVLVAGPVDAEIPKLTDCGIARIEGVATGLGAATRAYAGFEQLIALPAQQNPLVGPWTDVHALSATIWYLVTGEQWCQGPLWFSGERRSLQHLPRIHPGFSEEQKLLEELERILRKGASPGLPEEALVKGATGPFLRLLQASFATIRTSIPRYASVDALGRELVPLLDDFAARWRAKASRERRPITAYRASTLLPSSSEKSSPLLTKEIPAKRLKNDPRSLLFRPGPVVFQPDGKVLGCSEERVVLFVDDQPYLALPSGGLSRDAFSAIARESFYVGVAAELGYVLVGAQSILTVRAGQWRTVILPQLAGREVGRIVCARAGSNRLTILTAETDDSNGGPELWWTTQGETWEGPVLVPMAGEPLCIAEGPHGALVAGGRDKKRARAAFLHADGSLSVYTQGIAGLLPFEVAEASAERGFFAVSGDAIVFLDRTIDVEYRGLPDRAVQIALDPIGVPWLVLRHVVMRRYIEGDSPSWQEVHRRDPSRPAFVAMGFSASSARVLDVEGGIVELTPGVAENWGGLR